MKLTRAVEVEVRVTPLVRGDGAWEHAPWIGAYRLWIMRDPQFGRWWQCYEWERLGGNRERTPDGWIPSYLGRSADWPASAANPASGDEPPP